MNPCDVGGERGHADSPKGRKKVEVYIQPEIGIRSHALPLHAVAIPAHCSSLEWRIPLQFNRYVTCCTKCLSPGSPPSGAGETGRYERSVFKFYITLVRLSFAAQIVEVKVVGWGKQGL